MTENSPELDEQSEEQPSNTESYAPEVWNPLEDFPDYEISTHGRVRSYKSQRGRSLKPRILTISRQRDLPVVWLRRDSNTYLRRIDKLVLETFVGHPPTPKHGPARRNNIMADCHVENLMWEFGLARGPYSQKPRKRRKKTSKAVAVQPPITATVIPGVSTLREQRILYNDDIQVLYNVTEQTVDLTQPHPSNGESTAVFNLGEIPELIRALQRVVDTV